jgi:hypothetical protein
MDIYQKVLVKLYGIAGDRDNADVDFTELLKKEGFYSNINDITSRMSSEGWITESRPRHVKLTHWGIAAAKKLSKKGDKTPNELVRHAARLKSEVQEFATLVAEFSGEINSDNFSRLYKKLADINTVTDKIRKDI